MAKAVQSQNPSLRNPLTPDRLREVLHYDPTTGVFTWLVKPRPAIAVGSIAGSKKQRGYVGIQINKIAYKAHRLAWLYIHGEWPPVYIDHINGDTGDNRLSNLRLANAHENARNRKPPVRSYDLPKGVSYLKKYKVYCASVGFHGRTIWLGRFSNPEDAHAAYCAKSRELFGDYVRSEILPD